MQNTFQGLLNGFLRERERPDGDAKMRPLLLLVTALFGKAVLNVAIVLFKKYEICMFLYI